MPESRFTGKQVVGIVVGIIVVLAIGLIAGGVVGYRWGQAAGAQQTIVQAPVQNGQGNQQSRGFQLPQPFNQLPSGNPNQPYLGVEYETITPDIAARDNMTGTTGAILRTVIAGGPADTAGLKVGDVITAVDGQPVDEQHALRDQIAAHKIGDEVTLTVVTGTPNGPTNSHDVKVTLGSAPQQQSFSFQFPPNFDPNAPFGQQPPQPSQPIPANAPYLGVEFEMLTPQLAGSEGITGTTGTIIRSVIADSPAAQAGLQRNDVITAVDGAAVDDQNTLANRVLEHTVGDVVTLTVVTGSANGPTNSREVKVTLAQRPADNQLQIPGNIPGAPSPDSRSG